MFRQKQKTYILVHCTHGHNRTGYMIIHYLMRAMSMSVTQVSYRGVTLNVVFLLPPHTLSVQNAA